MTMTSLGLLALAAFAGVALFLKGRRDHQDAMDARARMLDDCTDLFEGSRIMLAPDGFPVLAGRAADGRTIRIDLIADTLVVRRLPQLWLRVSLLDEEPRRSFSIGALTRSTGAEFYAVTSEFPERIDHHLETPLLIRGRSVPDDIRRRSRLVFPDLFDDDRLKEAALTPRGTRIVRQASQGDRASHLVLRQIRFGVIGITPEMLQLAMDDAERLERGITHEIRLAEVA